jgi:hypothetical protein
VTPESRLGTDPPSRAVLTPEPGAVRDRDPTARALSLLAGGKEPVVQEEMDRENADKPMSARSSKSVVVAGTKPDTSERRRPCLCAQNIDVVQERAPADRTAISPPISPSKVATSSNSLG